MLSSFYFPLCVAVYDGYTWLMLFGRTVSSSHGSPASLSDGDICRGWPYGDPEISRSPRLFLREEGSDQLGRAVGGGRVVTIRIEPAGAGVSRVPVTRLRRVRDGCVGDVVEISQSDRDAIPDQVGDANSQDGDVCVVGPRASGPEGIRGSRVRSEFWDTSGRMVKGTRVLKSQNPIFPRNPQAFHTGISPLVSELIFFAGEITSRYRLAKRYPDQTMVGCYAFIAQTPKLSHVAQTSPNDVANPDPLAFG